MANPTLEVRQQLLRALRLRTGYAENAPAASIMFPVPEHLRAVEAGVVLIVGDRGAGKSLLKDALNDPQRRSSLLHRAPGVRAPTGDVNWIAGWPLGKSGPDSRGWRQLLTIGAGHNDDAVTCWAAYLVRALRLHLTAAEQDSLRPILEAEAADASRVVHAHRTIGVTATAALDRLDGRMLDSDQWIFVAYDELDTVVVDDWDSMGKAIRGLVSFWAAYARRWQRLRPKIFLRSDFYKHHRDIAGADVSKIAGNRVELQWSDKDLYGSLIMHVLNASEESKTLIASHFSKTIRTIRDSTLGLIPEVSKASDAKPFVDRLVSEYMGANKGKGLAFRWILEHLRDGNGHAMPRSLVLLIEQAADLELAQPRATGAHLLHHVSIRNALDRVSQEYVNQAKTHEFLWLDGLATRLKANRAVPWQRRELVKMLSVRFDEPWSPTGARPPGSDAAELIENLTELGVLRARSDETLDVPDLYLDGLGLSRSGGVAKK